MSVGLTTEESAGRRKQMSYAEFLSADGEGHCTEWVDGSVVPLPPATDTHADVTLFIASLIRYALDRERSGVVLMAPFNMKTGPDLPGRAPDVLVVTVPHLSRIRMDHLEGPADMVFEVVGGGSRRTDEVVKFSEYESGGVREYWIVDPEQRTMHLFQLGFDKRFHRVEHNEDGALHSTLLPGIWFGPRWLGSRPLPIMAHVLRLWGML